MQDAHRVPTYPSPNVDVSYDTEPGSGEPLRSWEEPRGNTVRDSGPDQIERDRLSIPSSDTFITEVRYAKQSILDTSVMFQTVPWDPALVWEIRKVTRGSTEASVIIHGDYGFMPVQSTESMIFGSAQVGAGFTTLLDYRNWTIDAQKNYRWKSGQAVDAVVRYMQRHMISLYLAQDRVPYEALIKLVRGHDNQPYAGMTPRAFLEEFENEGFNIVRRSRWPMLVTQMRERIQKKYDYNHDLRGGANSDSTSNSIMITEEIVNEARRDPEGLYVIWQGDLDTTPGSQIRTVASWEYVGAPGSMFVMVSPIRYRGMNVNWLESRVMHHQHSFFPLQVDSGDKVVDYEGLDVFVPDFASEKYSRSSHYRLRYTDGLSRLLGGVVETKKLTEISRSQLQFEKWFETEMIATLRKDTGKWTDFGEFVKVSSGNSDKKDRIHRRSAMATVLPPGMEWVTALRRKLLQKYGKAADPVAGAPVVDLGKSDIIEKHAQKLENVNQLVIAGMLEAFRCKQNHNELLQSLMNLQIHTRYAGAEAKVTLYDICRTLQILELPQPFGMCIRRSPVFLEHMILSITNYAAYHQEDVVDQVVQIDPVQGGTSVNFVQKFKDYMIENRGIVQYGGAFPIKGKHLEYGSRAGYEKNGFQEFARSGQGAGRMTSAVNVSELRGSGHFVFPVMMCEAHAKPDFMPIIGYDDPAFITICGEAEVLRQEPRHERALSTSEAVERMLGIISPYENQLRNWSYFIDTKKETVKVQGYSWAMETVGVKPNEKTGVLEMDRVGEKHMAEAGPTHDRPFIYVRDPPFVTEQFASSMAHAFHPHGVN